MYAGAYIQNLEGIEIIQERDEDEEINAFEVDDDDVELTERERARLALQVRLDFDDEEPSSGQSTSQPAWSVLHEAILFFTPTN